MYRSTKKELNYKKYKEGEKGCYFCNPEPKVVVKRTKNFYISKNNFPYDFWDGQKVLDHLLIISKQHSSYLNEYDTKLVKEYAKLLNKYYKLGYDIFTRTVESPSRSQTHFHSHLIKTNGKKFKSLSYTKDPYSLEVEK